LGIKLFDLTVTRSGQTLNAELPELARYPRLAEGIGASVRRIFLVPLPEPGDRLRAGATSYVLSRPWREGGVRFTFGGSGLVLQQTRAEGGEQDWTVAYYQYHRLRGVNYPAGIVLADARAGYRLTLWLDTMRRIDE
jgi:hypothetical protein